MISTSCLSLDCKFFDQSASGAVIDEFLHLLVVQPVIDFDLRMGAAETQDFSSARTLHRQEHRVRVGNLSGPG